MEVYEGEKIFVELLNPKNLKICPALNSPRGAGGNNSKPTLSVQGNTVRLDFFTSTTCDLKISVGPKNDELFRFYHLFNFLNRSRYRYKITARFKRRDSQIHAVELLEAQEAEKILEEKEKMIAEVAEEPQKPKTAEKEDKVEKKEVEIPKKPVKEQKQEEKPAKVAAVKEKKQESEIEKPKEIEPENVKINAKSFSFAPNSTKDDILKTIFDYFMHHSLSEICEKIDCPLTDDPHADAVLFKRVCLVQVQIIPIFDICRGVLCLRNWLITQIQNTIFSAKSSAAFVNITKNIFQECNGNLCLTDQSRFSILSRL